MAQAQDTHLKTVEQRLLWLSHWLCQNKPACPTASWKLTSARCPMKFRSAISKPAPRSSNLQSCSMSGFHSH